MALLAGALTPSFDSALVEYRLRADARQLALLIKVATNRAHDENRPFLLRIEGGAVTLRPIVGPGAPEAERASDEGSFNLAPKQALLTADPDKPGAWQPTSTLDLVFRPGELCPITSFRLTRGEAYLQMTFQPLTANVVEESYSIP